MTRLVELRLVNGDTVAVNPDAVGKVEKTEPRRGLECVRVHLASAGGYEVVVGTVPEIAALLGGDGFVALEETEEQRQELAAAEKRKPARSGKAKGARQWNSNLPEEETA